MKRIVLSFFAFLILILIYYHKAFSFYFQGDERFYFSEYFPLVTNPLIGIFQSIIKSVVDAYWISGGGHVVPLQSLLWFVSILIFRLNFTWYILLGLLLHALNCLLLFKLCRALKVSSGLAFFASLFLAINVSHFQAVTWPMVTIYDLLSTSLILISLLALLGSFQKKKNQIVISLGSFVGALLIKENAVVLFVLIPLITYLFDSRSFRKVIKAISVLAIVYFLFRFILPKFFVAGEIFQNTLHIGMDTLQNYIQIFSNMALQDLVSYSTLNKQISLATQESVHIVIFAMAILISVFCFKERRRSESKIILIGMAMIFVNAFIVLLTSLYSSYKIEFLIIDSRYLYLVSVAWSFIFIGVGKFIHSKLRKDIKWKVIAIYCLVIMLFLISSYFTLQQILIPYEQTGIVRKQIINSIQSDSKNLSANTVFLIESNQGYYGFAQIPPFQTNLGQVLAIQYFNKGELGPQFVNTRSLQKIPLNKSWYFKDKNLSFGYYLNREDLFKDGLKNNISERDIKAYSWDGKENRLINTTETFLPEYKNEVGDRIITRNWKKEELEKFSFKIDPGYSEQSKLANSIELNNGSIIRVAMFSKDNKSYFHNFVQTLTDSDGQTIGQNWRLVNITNENYGTVTCLYVLTGKYPVYFVPQYDGSSYIRIETVGDEFENSTKDDASLGKNEFIELIIKTLRYNN